MMMRDDRVWQVNWHDMSVILILRTITCGVVVSADGHVHTGEQVPGLDGVLQINTDARTYSAATTTDLDEGTYARRLEQTIIKETFSLDTRRCYVTKNANALWKRLERVETETEEIEKKEDAEEQI